MTTDTVIEPSDAKLLDAERAEPGLLAKLKNTASAAYYQARKHDENGPGAVDKVWNDLHRTWHHNNLVSVTANPNSPADLAARADTLRSTQRAIEYFNGVTGKGLKKPAPGVWPVLAAQRLALIHDAPLEAAIARYAEPAHVAPPQAVPKPFFPPDQPPARPQAARQHAVSRGK